MLDDINSKFVFLIIVEETKYLETFNNIYLYILLLQNCALQILQYAGMSVACQLDNKLAICRETYKENGIGNVTIVLVKQ